MVLVKFGVLCSIEIYLSLAGHFLVLYIHVYTVFVHILKHICAHLLAAVREWYI